MRRSLAALAMLVGLLVGTSAADGAERFTDPSGDSGRAPDVTSVTVTDDFGTGTIGVGLDVAAFPQNGNSSITLWLDTDKNPATGSPTGNEYGFVVDNVGGYSWGWMRWNGTTFVQMATSPTTSASIADQVVLWKFNKADIGAPAGLRLYVMAVELANPTVDRDRAPDSDAWTYDLSTAPPPPVVEARPVIGAPKATPAVPVAGKRFTVSFVVTRSDTGAPLTTGTMVCDPSIGGKTVAHAESLKGGTARLSMTVPKSAKGKQLKVKLTIAAGGQSAAKVATYRVR